jgi:transcriptional regulator with PAS, ATPase and Fis domain
VAPTRACVLIAGESGTGKELVAETVHRMSPRAERPFLALNCGAIAASVIESELFGHERGSFTGADRSRKGYFEQAHEGTLLLDEITEMPLELQVKLLRVLESRQLYRVGASEPIEVDVRVLAATNRDPMQAIKEGRLREDLYYRLNVFSVVLPPLRERGEDARMLAEHFLAEINERDGSARRWSKRALDEIVAYPWPGNVRELRNVVERLAVLSGEVIDRAGLAQDTGRGGPAEVPALTFPPGTQLADVERRMILATLRMVGGDKCAAAARLGISLKTLYNRLNVYRAANQLEVGESGVA